MDQLNFWIFYLFLSLFVFLSKCQQSITYDSSFKTDQSSIAPDIDQSSINNVEANEQNRSHEILETVRLPQNRIPLRLLQRNKFRPILSTKTTTSVPNVVTIEEPQSTPKRPSPVENMIIDKSRLASNQGTDVDLQRQKLIPPTEKPLPPSSFVIDPSPDSADLQAQQHIQTLYDRYRTQAISRRLQAQFELGQPQPVESVPFYLRPHQTILNNLFISRGGNFSHTKIEVPANETDLNMTTPFPLPVPLENVPFDQWPQQEIKNHLLEAQWKRSGKNISLYYPRKTTTNSMANSTIENQATTPGPVATTITVTTTTMLTPTRATSTTQGRSNLANFMVNKNGNAREYLKAIYDNQLGGERLH